ncbi:MAG: hypothetical protein M3511_12100, partial [Deinococcota bacterium]|nr:hypothetical protein [Deinococcota bacterium]
MQDNNGSDQKEWACTSAPDIAEVVYRVSPVVTNRELNELFGAPWPGHGGSDFMPILERSLLYVCAYHGGRLTGFVNVAW